MNFSDREMEIIKTLFYRMGEEVNVSSTEEALGDETISEDEFWALSKKVFGKPESPAASVSEAKRVLNEVGEDHE